MSASRDQHGPGDEPSAPIGRIREYLARLRKENPDCAVVFMATTRAPSRKAKWALLDEYNRELQQIVKEGKNLGLRARGQPHLLGELQGWSSSSHACGQNDSRGYRLRAAQFQDG